MTGEIPVQDIMDRVARLKEWQAKQQLVLEWIALKEYWRATEQDKPVVQALYGTVLIKALTKYRKRYSALLTR